jgi:Isochorismatase family
LGDFSMSKALVTLQMPSPPDPVPVLIDSATTALLVFDIIEHICAREPKCREQLVPAVASLLERARQASVAIAYGTRAANMSTWLPEVAPAPGDIKIESHAQDRFYNTDLDKALKAKGITTLVLSGWKISVGRSNAARLYRRCARRRHFRRDGLRNRHREVPDPQSEQREPRERAFETQSLNAKPHRFNQLQIAALGSAPTRSGLSDRFTVEQ